MLGIENGYAIGKDLSRLRHFRDRGIVYMTLCHNGDNDICDSARGKGEHGGLSAFGREVVQEMNREANTMGSKASDIELVNLVVGLKSEIEKIREQVQNLE